MLLNKKNNIIIPISILLCIAILWTPAFAGKEAKISKAYGTVDKYLQKRARWEKAFPGSPLGAGDKVKTGGDGSVIIIFPTGSKVYLKENSVFSFEKIHEELEDGVSHETITRFELGKMRAQVEKLEGNSSFKVKTPTSIAAVRGTDFFMNFSLSDLQNMFTGLFVLNGKIFFSNLQGGNGQNVGSGQQSNGFGDGSITDPQNLTIEQQNQMWLDFFMNFGHSSSAAAGGMVQVTCKVVDSLNIEINDPNNQNPGVQSSFDPSSNTLTFTKVD